FWPWFGGSIYGNHRQAIGRQITKNDGDSGFFAMPRKSSEETMSLHPEDAEPRGLGRRRIEPGGERKPQDRARVGGVDDAVVPDARGGVVGMPLAFVLLAKRRLERLLVGGAPGTALGLDRFLAQQPEHARSLLAPHDRDARVRPHPEKARSVGAPAH